MPNRAAIILTALMWLTPVAVANKCVGEASFAVRECACTVYNRLQAGWNERKVLRHYYAPNGHATPAQVAQVADVLSGATACDAGLYFMYSRADVRWLGYEAYTPALVVQDGNKEVRFYGRWFKGAQ